MVKGIPVADVSSAHHTPYLSPSRLSAYDWCPAQYYERYVLGLVEPPAPERLFGVAVHAGLEAHFNGEANPIAVYLERWDMAVREIRDFDEALLPTGQILRTRGIELVEEVRKLGLEGTPELHALFTFPGVRLPFVGYIDLVTPGHLYDFKTTRSGWTQQKADAQIWQPAIYSAAYDWHKSMIPRFTYIVLPRIPGPVQLLDGSRTGQQICDAFKLAQQRLEAIDAGEFDCRCGQHTKPSESRPGAILRVVRSGMWA